MTTQPQIFDRMAAILDEMPAIGKDSFNEQQKFKYRGIDDALNALNPLLGKHGVFYVPSVTERVAEIRQTSGGKSLWTVHLHVVYRFYATDGSFVEADAWGEGTDMADKATSKAMTMAEKNVLFQTFAIAVQDPDDGDREGEEAGPADWFVANGWADKAAHDTWRAGVIEQVREMDLEARAAFNAALEKKGVPDFRRALTHSQAGIVDSHLGGFADVCLYCNKSPCICEERGK